MDAETFNYNILEQVTVIPPKILMDRISDTRIKLIKTFSISIAKIDLPFLSALSSMIGGGYVTVTDSNELNTLSPHLYDDIIRWSHLTTTLLARLTTIRVKPDFGKLETYLNYF